MEQIKTCSKCSEKKPATTEFFWRDKSRKDKLDHRCKVCSRKRLSKGRKKNPEKHKKYMQQWRDANRDKYRAYFKKSSTKRVRQWRAKNPDKTRAIRYRYQTKKDNMPNSFSDSDISYSLTYFNGCCAICGRPLSDLFGEHTLAFDHWIALTDPRPDNPGTIPTNMIPLCHGIEGCNNKKSNRDPEEWLIAEFGKRKAVQILERIETFFNSLDD